MALDITATQSGTSVTVAWSGSTGTTSIYRSVNSADVASSSAATAAISAGTLKLLKSSTAASGSITDSDIVGSETYYYAAINTATSPEFDSANVTTTITAPACCITDTNELLVTSQNAASAQAFNMGVDTRYVYLLALTSASSLSDATIEALADDGQTIKKLAYADVTTISNKQPAITGTVTIKYCS